MLEKERKLHVCVRVERLSLLSWGEGMPERTSPRPSFWDFWRRHLGVQEHPSTHLVQLTISTTGSLSPPRSSSSVSTDSRSNYQQAVKIRILYLIRIEGECRTVGGFERRVGPSGSVLSSFRQCGELCTGVLNLESGDRYGVDPLEKPGKNLGSRSFWGIGFPTSTSGKF